MSSLIKKDVFDDVFENFFEPITRIKNQYSLKTDILDLGEVIVFEIEIPGVKKENIKVDVFNGYLNIEVNDIKENNSKFLRKERLNANLKRSFYLGDGYKTDEAKSKYSDGVLKITLPKNPETNTNKTHYIDVN